MVNKHANTNVTMHGEINQSGFYSGHIEGGSADELYAFVKYIEDSR